MNTYTARASWGEGWWGVWVDEVEGLFTQTRSLDEIPAMVKDALALFPELETDPDHAIINIAFNPTPGDALDRARGTIGEIRAELRADGMSPEDITRFLSAEASRPVEAPSPA